MRSPVIEKIGGTTLRVTFTSSGAAPSTISSALLDKNDALVSCGPGVGSLTNFYFQHQLPTSPGWYINEWKATIQGLNFVERQFIRIRTMETD